MVEYFDIILGFIIVTLISFSSYDYETNKKIKRTKLKYTTALVCFTLVVFVRFAII